MSPHRELRPSTAERAPYEQALAQGYAEGRLDLATYETRMQQVAEATSMGELERCVRDVPFTFHAEQAAAVKRTQSRRTFLGTAALAVVAGASYWATTLIPEPPPAPAASPTPTPSLPSRTPPTPGRVATTMPQVPFGTADSFAILAGHLDDLGVTAVHRVMMRGTWASVDGLRGTETVDVHFQADYAPTVRESRPNDSPTLPPADLAHLDAADLLRRSGDLIALGDEPHIDVRWYRNQWVVDITGATDQRLYWDITGTRVLSW